MTRTPLIRRSAFTLIELLVVFSIIAVLAALTAGAFARIRTAQTRSATDAALSKINSLIERRIKAINDQVADDIKNNHPTYAQLEISVINSGGNRDTAKAVWTYAKMKNELPMSITEALTPTPVFGASPLPVKSIFSSNLTLAMATAGGTPEEIGGCLYLAVTLNAGGGTATDQDGLQQQTGTIAGTNLKCFKDAWGTPIAFVRTAYNTEVNAPPFIRQNAGLDPFDPRQKLGTFATQNPNWWPSIRPNVSWANSNTTPAILLNGGTYPGAVNQTWTAISAGPDKQWFGAPADIYGLPPVPDTDAAKDNQLSYRLRREGNRGD